MARLCGRLNRVSGCRRCSGGRRSDAPPLAAGAAGSLAAPAPPAGGGDGGGDFDADRAGATGANVWTPGNSGGDGGGASGGMRVRPPRTPPPPPRPYPKSSSGGAGVGGCSHPLLAIIVPVAYASTLVGTAPRRGQQHCTTALERTMMARYGSAADSMVNQSHTSKTGARKERGAAHAPVA